MRALSIAVALMLCIGLPLVGHAQQQQPGLFLGNFGVGAAPTPQSRQILVNIINAQLRAQAQQASLGIFYLQNLRFTDPRVFSILNCQAPAASSSSILPHC